MRWRLQNLKSFQTTHSAVAACSGLSGRWTGNPKRGGERGGGVPSFFFHPSQFILKTTNFLEPSPSSAINPHLFLPR